MTPTYLFKALRAIAEGYGVQPIEDQYILVENPDFKEENGDDPYLLIDVAEVEREYA
jgi:hypothetical protein